MSIRIYVAEAWHELRAGLSSSLVPLMFTGLVGYVFMMLFNAQYLRDMGGADVPRNSALLVFQMTSGQAFWLIFAWAWVFAQVVTRDRAANLHEIVLSAPVSLRKLLLARYVGAVALACVLGSSSSIALLLVPALGALGAFPANAVGPTPLLAIAYAWLLFVLPSALGLGAIYVLAALRTRSTAGPFAAAALIILLWMGAMVVLRSGDIQSDVATFIDVSGFGEAQRQTELWTPAQKAHGMLTLTGPLVLNRLLWTAIPLALFALALVRLRRERLVLISGLARRRQPAQADRELQVASSARAFAPSSPSWLRATWNDTRWQLTRAMSGWTFSVTVLLWTAINVGAPFVHMLGHAEGPLVPRGQILAPFLVNLCYVFSVFLVAGFVGALARRDQQQGFSEMIDATPAPLGVRVLSSALSAAALTCVLALIPTLSAWIVMALAVPEGFDVWSPVLVNGVVAAPALLELCAATFLIHAWVRSAGTAYAMSMLAAFIAIVNHELGLVSYPPFEVGIPAQVELSELPGFQPWLAAVGALDAFKLSGAMLMCALAWLLYARGTALTWRVRARAAWRRLRGGAGVLTASALAALLASAWLLHDRLVLRGGYRTVAERERDDASWEKKFWQRAGPFALEGGEVDATIDPESLRAHTVLRLHGVRSPSGRLSGALPPGTRHIDARVGMSPREVTTALEHFELPLGSCPPAGCEVTLEIEVAADGWELQEVPPWLHRSGVWARARDLVPRLGLDAERRLRSPSLRRTYALPERPEAVPSAGLVPAHGVAPAGHWRWTVHVTKLGEHTAFTGDTEGPLDFAFAWLPEPLNAAPMRDLIVWHGPSHRQVAAEIVDDLRAMQACVNRRTALPADIDTVLQVPRGLGTVSVHGRVLWLPEHEGWDVGPSGTGRVKRRAAIAQALASNALASAADLRAEPGSRWLTVGVAGFLGLACLRELDGAEAWLAWMARRSDHVAQQLGALDAPLVGLAEDGPAKWVDEYAPLATLGWAQSLSIEAARAAIGSVIERVRAGGSLREALALTIGPQHAARLLGVPFASDVAVVETDTGLEVRGERSRWVQGGWQPDSSAVFTVTQHFDGGSSLVSQLPLRVEAQERITVFDAEPSFERSPLDNVWPRRSR